MRQSTFVSQQSFLLLKREWMPKQSTSMICKLVLFVPNFNFFLTWDYSNDLNSFSEEGLKSSVLLGKLTCLLLDRTLVL